MTKATAAYRKSANAPKNWNYRLANSNAGEQTDPYCKFLTWICINMLLQQFSAAQPTVLDTFVIATEKMLEFFEIPLRMRISD